MQKLHVVRAERSRRGARPGSDMQRLVRDALGHLNDLAYLQTHPLTRELSVASAGDARGAGSALQRALLQAIESLRPDARAAVESPARRRHQMLVLRYADGMTAAAVQARLGIGKSEYHRQHQQALGAVVSLLAERMEGVHGARASLVPDSAGPDGEQDNGRTMNRRPGDATEFSHSSRRAPPRLPAPLTGLIGRDAELEEITGLLRTHRLVTLSGPPGTGKTRLAIALAQAATADFPDGVFFIPLATLTQPDLLLPTIAEALQVRVDREASIDVSIAEALGSSRVLLVLDNFEQIVDAAPALAQLLQACPLTTALVTSRVRLRVRGEREVVVSPLAVPDSRAVPSADTVGAYPAVQLFMERAHELDSSFGLTQANAPAVAEICRRLEGLPLALELAAARIDVLPPGELLNRLERRLPVLTDGPRDLPVRHRTLRGAIAWSYDLLDQAQQALFRRLAVFAAGWTVQAAQAVIADRGIDVEAGAPGDPARPSLEPVVDGLAALVRTSLVQRPTPGESRFGMLETIREYALERLSEAGEEEELRAAHAAYFTRLAEQSPRSAIEGLELEALRHFDWWQRAEAEQDNLRAAFEWAVDHGEGDQALWLGGALAELWTLRGGHYGEGRARLTQALALSGAVGPSRARALALERVGGLAIRAGDYVVARSFLEQAIQVYETLGDRRAVALAIRQLKQAYRREGHLAEAHDLDERALAMLRDLGDVNGVAQVLASLGHHFLLQGEVATARAHLEDSLALAPTPLALCVLGNVACDERSWDEARDYFARGLAIYRQLGDQDGIARALEGFAGLAAAEGRHPSAVRLLAAATALREATQTPLPPSWRPDLERRLLPAEETLASTERAVAWEEGLRLTPEEAVDEALGQLPASTPD